MLQTMKSESVSAMLERVLEDHPGERVSLGDIVQTFGARAYGPALLFVSLISMVPPISVTPFLPAVTGTLMLVLSVQLLMLRRTPWLPEVVTRYSFSRDRLLKAVENARPWLLRFDRFVRPRLTFLLRPPFLNVIGAICAALALLSWVLSPLPGGENIPAAAVLIFGLALTARDGLLAFIGLAATAASVGTLLYFRHEIAAAIVQAVDTTSGWFAGLHFPSEILWVLGGLTAVLAFGSVVRLAASFRNPAAASHLRSLVCWWVLFLLLALAVLLGAAVAAVLFTIISWLGLGEFRRLAQERVARHFWWLAFVAVPVQYVVACLGWIEAFWTFIPIAMFLVLLTALVITAETGRFVETAGIIFLGLMMIVFLLSHAVLIFSLPEGASLFLYLIVLTSGNDIAQALWGRSFGRRKIAPRVSPNKTWEGFALGGLTTVAVAVGLATMLTPFDAKPIYFAGFQSDGPCGPAVLAAALIVIAGFFGDLTLSAVKREVGVKDSGAVLPGQGGVLDRIDSLIFTAPVFFYFMYFVYR